MTVSRQIAEQIRTDAASRSLKVSADLTHDYNAQTREWDGKVIDATVTVVKHFVPGDAAAYMLAERDCLDILNHFRMTRPGTVWGTDSGSVGGHVGLTEGYCRLSKSGVEIRLARQFA